MVDFYRSFIGVLSLSMKLSLSCRALLWSAPGRDFLSDRGVVDATTLARLRERKIIKGDKLERG